MAAKKCRIEPDGCVDPYRQDSGAGATKLRAHNRPSGGSWGACALAAIATIGTLKGRKSMMRVLIGFDPAEAAAFHVLSHSIHMRATAPVSITPIVLRQLGHILSRPRDPLQSTEFSFSRFLAPYLCAYQGWALYLDCDMLFLDDIARLWALRDERYAVMVVKHQYVPKSERKLLGATQTRYEKKNWSSLMLFNMAKCSALTPAYVNSASGLELHQFKWLPDEGLVGELPRRWNHLVGEYPYDPDVSNVHFTIGGPYFNQYAACEYADRWFAARDDMLFAQQSASGAPRR
jgi:hypothetical protein